MALTKTTPAPAVTEPVAPRPSKRTTWAKAEVQRTITLTLPAARRLVRDVTTWPLWNPVVRAASHCAGPLAGAGMECRVVVGVRPFAASLGYLLVAADGNGTTVFAGRWGRRCSFIDVVELHSSESGTSVNRRIELMTTGWLRPFSRRLAALARRRLERSLDHLVAPAGSYPESVDRIQEPS